MPVSKQPRHTPPTTSATKASAAPLPDRRALEIYLAAITGARRDDAVARAQEVMYDAWDKTTSRARVTLARKALAISPLCADAYNLLADEAASEAEARDLYARGVEAGELALGPEGFEEYAGRFWGYLETRPYMRARHGLASTLLRLGEEDAAMAHFRAMLKLNPGDNQGIRYLLLGSLLQRDDMASVKALLAEYPEEWSVYWLYTRLLIAYREDQASTPKTRKLLKDARSANEHVAAILAGTMPAMHSASGYISVGGADEATDYVCECGAAWRKTPGAVEWLATAIGSEGPTKRRVSSTARRRRETPAGRPPQI